MAESRRRLLNLILIVSTLVFVSFSLIPLISVFSGSGLTNPTSSTNQVANERLIAEADGYAEVLKREPDNVVALKGLVDLRLKLQQYPQAIEPLAHWASLEPDNAALTSLLGKLKLVTGDPKGAAAQFRQLYQKNPTDRLILQDLVSAEVEAKNGPAATTLLQAELKKTPNDRDLQILLADVYSRTNQTAGALKLYDQLISSDPQDYRPVWRKALALTSDLKDPAKQAEAQQLFQKAVSLAPEEIKPQIKKNAEIYANLAANPPTPTLAPSASPAS